ncbi:xanthine dehydrogenase family protein molybdopterin-binding subunit [Phenylobacterium sp.]|jgi:CO/xanthine dehydrogenase Mo-binding subunit|uniref:xanthine dehydrogenase family protein molybdopterin-binding subunit n=1 Tax=Phenylobacterium sp. TaxID=1871053 RepID=UPI002E33D64C|nr:molybdopterin cofactor-binding domain-containing protein [Phenylobacterium sp.]HEX3363997.1 molybdopterin cofactor-binding domain-containing protein [Phenylobacterium sp.]
MIPPMLAANPRLDRWVSFEPDGRARIAFGRMEYGQGIFTALAQMAADELDVPFDRLNVVASATGAVPDEGLTVGSMSIEFSGPAIRMACAETRALFTAAAAARLGCGPAELDVRDGAFVRGGAPTGLDYWSLAGDVDLAREATGEATLKTPDRMGVVGESWPRLDLPPKLFGAAFLHDLVLPGMRHARVLRQPSPDARLKSLDEDAVRSAVADVDILIERAFVALICDTEAKAARAHAAAEAAARWEGVRALDPALSEPAAIKTLPHEDFAAGAEPAGPSNRRRISATYGKPFLSHGSLGPSMGLAQYQNGKLTIWTHNQGVYWMRGIAARITGLAPEAIEVIHGQGPGCYGHNGADDPPIDAALIAIRRPGPPIRVQWRREDEFGHAPVGTAMVMELAAELDASGRLVDYTAEIWNTPHTGARGTAVAESALPGYVAPPRRAPQRLMPDGSRFSGGLLNATPSYEIAATRTLEHVIETPIRSSSLRSLGGAPNTFASESFVDELAEAAGQEPLAYRLAMLNEPRGRAVLTRLAEMCGWAKRWEAGTGRGLGLAYDRHRGRGAMVACAAELEVEAEVKLVKLWCACDGGLIINPDGARNQIEGGMIMAASWALKEQVKLGGAGIVSTTWDDYPILRFSEVPPIEIELIDTRDQRPCGLGEVSQGPVMAAIGNAVAHALGARIRELPMTGEKIASALLKG